MGIMLKTCVVDVVLQRDKLGFHQEFAELLLPVTRSSLGSDGERLASAGSEIMSTEPSQ